jgi:NAD(P)-dependent dehydrogenase (short-subunit alcohol dehydrogenase family)
MPAFDSVLITGASSGIGRALALASARPGAVLHLSGRDAARLAAVESACAARGAEVRPRLLDVREAAAVADWIDGAGRLDLVVANAGISAGTGDGTPERPEQTRAIFAVNLDGVLNTALPALRVMAAQPADAAGVRGRIAVVASVAAFLPVPGAPAYCASKAAVDAWTIATAPTARRQGILLTSLCPGYVRTPLTAANRFPMPGLMAADRAAAIMLRAIAAGRVRVAFPWWIAAGARLVALLPPRWLGAFAPAAKAPLAGEG